MRSSAELGEAALEIFRAGVSAVDPHEAVRGALALDGDTLVVGGPGEPVRIPLAGRVRVIGAGKATARMALAVEEVLEARIDAGCVTVKVGHAEVLSRVELVEASHPVPDEAGLRGTRRQLELLGDLHEDDLVIALLSGGGSALLPLPAEGITLEEKQALTGGLLAAGATIHEINAVRKHVSAVKGGQLARLAAPARLLTLVLSDVVGDDLDVIASGPTVPDSSSFEESRDILVRRGLWEGAPEGVRSRLEAGCAGEIEDTPGPGDPVFSRGITRVLASNRVALDACAARARELGWQTLVLSSMVQGEAREVARVVAALAREARLRGDPAPPPCCLVMGGETTVTIRGEGKGGRNQELALAAALEIAGEQGMAVFSGGTDGNDGPTDAAGGVVFGDTLARGEAAGLSAREYLERNDAYHYLDAVGGLVRTGPTGTNVMDVQLVLVDS